MQCTIRNLFIMHYLPVKAISVSCSNKLAVTKFMTSIIVAICVKNKLKLYFVCIVIFSTVWNLQYEKVSNPLTSRWMNAKYWTRIK